MLNTAVSASPALLLQRRLPLRLLASSRLQRATVTMAYGSRLDSRTATVETVDSNYQWYKLKKRKGVFCVGESCQEEVLDARLR